VIPASFHWERVIDSELRSGDKVQDLDALATALSGLGVAFRKTELILEIKVY
jgi:hypothetical protein